VFEGLIARSQSDGMTVQSSSKFALAFARETRDRVLVSIRFLDQGEAIVQVIHRMEECVDALFNLVEGMEPMVVV